MNLMTRTKMRCDQLVGSQLDKPGFHASDKQNGRQAGMPVPLLVAGEVLQDFGGVAFGFDGGPDGFDFAGFADEERAADDAHELASHELLLLPGAVGGDGFVVGIAEQRKIEFEFGLEQGLCFH